MAYTHKDNIPQASFNTGGGLNGAIFLTEDLALVSRQTGYSFMLKINCRFQGIPMTIWGGFRQGDTITHANMLPYVALPCPPYNQPLVRID